MVRQHGGELSARSEGLGFGSTFTLQLPLYILPNDKDVNNGGIDSPATEPIVPLSFAEEQAVVPQLPRSMSSSSVPLSAPVLSENSFRILVVDDVASNRKLISR